MQYHNNGNAKFLIEFFYKLQNLDLIPDIQIGGRLIKEQRLRSLTKCHCDPYPLALTSGKS